jgi:hypothetical protein
MLLTINKANLNKNWIDSVVFRLGANGSLSITRNESNKLFRHRKQIGV